MKKSPIYSASSNLPCFNFSMRFAAGHEEGSRASTSTLETIAATHVIASELRAGPTPGAERFL